MALSAAMVWEVRAAGLDTNGGGFKAGASGTDYSQQDAAQKSGADLHMHASTNTKCHPNAAGVAAADVGNVIYIASGTGWTPGFYEITAQDGTDWTLDRSPCAAGSGDLGTYKMGGALLTINILPTCMVTQNKAFVKKGAAAYQSNASITFTGIGETPGTFTILEGYDATRGDKGRPTLQLITNTGLNALAFPGNGWNIRNFIVDCNSLGTSRGIYATGSYSVAYNCKVSNFTTIGISISGDGGAAYDCEVTAGAAGAVGITANRVTRCYVHDNACTGLNNCPHVVRCLIVNNTGASSDGITMSIYGGLIVGNTIHGNGRDGIRHASYNINYLIFGNILTSNVGYGLRGNSMCTDPCHDGNAYWNNTAGAKNGCTSTTGAYAAAPYTIAFDITLTGDPYTNSAGGNFTLNNTAGAGAACRAAGIPGSLGGQTGYPDLGVYQHQEVVAGGFPILGGSVVR